jgi:transcriptional regulator with XRE-family HTH domain
MSEADPEHMTVNPIGERLRKAREASELTLEDVANRTRIPVRHLQNIENGEWESLPAPTYAIGFARSYANVVGLNGSEIGVELREEIGAGAHRPAATTAYYEPADPARVPPRSLALVAGAIALLLIIGYAVWRSGAVDDSAVDPAEVVAAEAPPEEALPATGGGTAAPVAPAATGPVTLTATEEVWLRVYEQGGEKLLEKIMTPGERYVVPTTAKQPLILTGRPNALRVTVGNTEIPALGPAERTISDVSLAPADLLARLGPATGAPAPTTVPPPPTP